MEKLLPDEVLSLLKSKEMDENDLSYFSNLDLKEFFTIENRIKIRKFLEEKDAILGLISMGKDRSLLLNTTIRKRKRRRTCSSNIPLPRPRNHIPF
jgi:hypothetical protein